MRVQQQGMKMLDSSKSMERERERKRARERETERERRKRGSAEWKKVSCRHWKEWCEWWGIKERKTELEQWEEDYSGDRQQTSAERRINTQNDTGQESVYLLLTVCSESRLVATTQREEDRKMEAICQAVTCTGLWVRTVHIRSPEYLALPDIDKADIWCF